MPEILLFLMAEKKYFHPSYKKEFRIESRIKPLVDIMNDVPFIKTISSCEGHYDPQSTEERKAYVLFESNISSRKSLEELMLKIYALTSKRWPEAHLDFYQKVYALPGENYLCRHWELRIAPFDKEASSQKKREITDEFIALAVRGVRNYLDRG